nr:hypothetical protein [Moritella viscosa]
MSMKLFKISVSNLIRDFRSTDIPNVYKVYFENCVSELDLRELFSCGKILASTTWLLRSVTDDAIAIISEVDSPKFPRKNGYKTFHISWSSGDAPEPCFLVFA